MSDWSLGVVNIALEDLCKCNLQGIFQSVKYHSAAFSDLILMYVSIIILRNTSVVLYINYSLHIITIVFICIPVIPQCSIPPYITKVYVQLISCIVMCSVHIMVPSMSILILTMLQLNGYIPSLIWVCRFDYWFHPFKKHFCSEANCWSYL